MATTSTAKPLLHLVFDNVQDDETIYQRCVIIKARYSPIDKSPSMTTVQQMSPSGDELYPPQTWPVAEGYTKIIVMLNPGFNVLHIHPNSDATQVTKLRLNYTPILKQPPLHLAVMFGSDSDLDIDFEPSKAVPGFDDRSSIDSAINRFRMTAYLWQAMIAEDMRMRGLGRRSFRLDEDWGIDTTSASFLHAVQQADIWEAGAARQTARIHLIKSDHTVEEITNAKIAQDNPLGRNKKTLHTWFTEALKTSGIGVFTDSARPIIAGLILDSRWVQEDLFVHGHAAMGSHNPVGVSLCVMGSHLEYCWPQYLEEINSYLMDASRPEHGEVSTANAETGTMWEVCSIGQTDFLHQLGHAFGAAHTTGIMRGGCARHWPRHFVVRTAPDRLTGEDGIVVKHGETANEATFDIKDLLAFSLLPQFWLPDDPRLPMDPLFARYMMPSVHVEELEDEEGNLEKQLVASSPANIVRVLWNGEPSERPSLEHQLIGARVPVRQIEESFSRDTTLRLSILAGNGKERVIPNFWDLVTDPSTIRIPGSDVVLHRRSVMCRNLEEGVDGMQRKTLWRWATLLSKRMEHGTIARANEINIRIGCYLLGLYVRFEDGFRVNCGPRFHKMMGGKYQKHFDGCIPEHLMIPRSQEIVRVEVGRDLSVLRGVTTHLSNGEVKGALSGGAPFEERCMLEASKGERIVGFYGRSYFGEKLDSVVEFGIITAPRDVELPVEEADYDRDDDPDALPSNESDLDAESNDPDIPNDADDSDHDFIGAMAGLEIAALDVED
ncbi:hypothetical protein INS49_007722 [Diaporthe citri]|uniref:uncharacterized protein n=1 Tax=Diaporthe citri TaxID=83186 RepID=UPI001C7F7BEC|nr:uncharacterized protein INS49_007722 [Diaporthe citri]KAG6362630.1 hypothetical protein INS49_007722 [Diaporthe citri]